MYADKIPGPKSKTVANQPPGPQRTTISTIQILDNRAEALVQRKAQEAIENSPLVLKSRAYQTMADNFVTQKAKHEASLKEGAPQENFGSIQKKSNNGGLPNPLKTGVENLSGLNMDDVRVHYNSSTPAQLQAHAYAQGTNIHLAAGQEKHLPHEAWHVVQQKQGRVKQTLQLKGGIAVNDNAVLEQEADVMGHKALQMKRSEYKSNYPLSQTPMTGAIAQRTVNLGKGAIAESKVLLIEISKTEDLSAEYEHLVAGLSEKAQLTILQDMIDAGYEITKTDFIAALETRVAEVNELKARIMNKQSIRGRFNELLYTHNTSLMGAMGVLGQGTFLSTVEDNVNFRHDIDSRYAGGLSFIMKKDFEKSRADVAYHDLYKKGEIFMGRLVGKLEPKGQLSGNQLKDWTQLTSITTAQSDFRKEPQMLPLFEGIIAPKSTYLVKLSKEIVAQKEKIKQNKKRQDELARALEILAETIKCEDTHTAEAGIRKDEVQPMQLPAAAAGSQSVKTKPAPAAMKKKFGFLSQPKRVDLIAQQQNIQKEALVCEENARIYEEKLGKLRSQKHNIGLEIKALQARIKLANENNSALSLVNPQLRIPRGKLTRDNIAYVIADKASYDKLVNSHNEQEPEKMAAASASATSGTHKKQQLTLNRNFFKTELLPAFLKTAQGKGVISKAMAKKNPGTAVKEAGIQFEKLLTEGKVRAIDFTSDNIYSHQAGRMGDPRRGPHEEASASAAAGSGMEISPAFYQEKMNNSPAALSNEAFLEFQKEYYKILVEEGLFRLSGRQNIHNDAEQSSKKSVGADEQLGAMEGEQASMPAALEPQDQWAARYGGKAEYGRNDHNDCLIYAIAFALGLHNITDGEVVAVRKALVVSEHMGVDARGFLPGYGRVISHVAQLLLAMREIHEGVTIHLESAIQGVAPVTEGNGPIQIFLFHDGVHFWWLRKQV